MDSALIPKGVKRCPTWQFILWIGGVSVIVLWGVYAMLLCWLKGLNQTNMNDSYGFALWIWADLTVIAIGGGAFFSGLLRYIFGKKELKSIINYAVVIGFVCYASAQLILGIDVGQPLRGWFIFWHANVHSMLTEVAFCLSCYFIVLHIEFIPLIREQIMVNVPVNPICQESCKGICQQCGSNLNRASCQCDKSERRGSAFEILKDFPVKQKP